MAKEYEKHNRELRKVRKFLKDKSQKTNFEIFLLKHYDYFFDLALRVTEESQEYTKNQEPGNGGKPAARERRNHALSATAITSITTSL